MAEHSNEHLPRRFLFTTTAGYGHFHPLVPLALALKDAGHEVAFAAPAYLRQAVEAAGIDFFAAGGDREKDPEFQELMAQLRTMPPGPESERVIFGKVFTGVNPRLMVPDLVEIARTWKADMLIRESAEFGAVIAAEHLGLPYADVCPGAYLNGIVTFEHGANENLDPIRQSWGLAPDPTLESLHRYLMVAYSPPTFAAVDIGVPGAYPATTEFFRPKFFDQAGDGTLPKWVSSMPEQPTVYVTLGTEANNMPGFYPGVLQTVIAGLREKAVNLIVTLGRDKDPEDFANQPPNVHIEQYIPQSLILPHCDLMVMHGGSNSLLQALDAGLPMVVVPLIADQFFNGAAIRALQLGQVIDLEHLTPDTVWTAVWDVLQDPAYRQNVARMQSEMHSLPEITQAVVRVEQIVAAHEAVRQLSQTDRSQYV
jgi:UDP:flavonoid glycosyltransferase YjiC (YdhE family)